jgi:ribosomal protein S18 acetylase RimI-like enzyme
LRIRPFAGTLSDAQGLIKVDGETFRQCDYAPAYLLDLLSGPNHWAAVAEEEGRVAGFVSAFETHSLAGDRWEVDELAVRPAYQGRGWGTRLVASAVSRGAAASGLAQARALVAAHNLASQRAFEKVGFHAQAEVDLLLYEVGGRVPRPQITGTPLVREVRRLGTPGAGVVGTDAGAIAALGGRPVAEVAALIERPDLTYLLAQEGERTVGYAELIEVRTLQYRGYWLESLVICAGTARADRRRIAKAVFSAAIEAAKRDPALDLAGYLSSREDEGRYAACVSEGFGRIEAYRVYVLDLTGLRQGQAVPFPSATTAGV